MLLPHQVLRSVYRWSVKLFNFMFVPYEAALREFWEREAGSEWCREGDFARYQPDPMKRLPISLWGDDAGVDKRNKLLCLLWDSVLVRGRAIDTRILFACSDYKGMLPDATERKLYQIFTWSVTACTTGVEPYEDWEQVPYTEDNNKECFNRRGDPLAGGYCLNYSETRGDAPWFVHTFRWEGFAHSKRCCHRCGASKTTRRLFFTNLSQTAKHRRTLYSHATYMGWISGFGAYRCPLTNIPGWHLFRAWLDALHCLDLGVCLHRPQ